MTSVNWFPGPNCPEGRNSYYVGDLDLIIGAMLGHVRTQSLEIAE
jgi:hypothetical protein